MGRRVKTCLEGIFFSKNKSLSRTNSEMRQDEVLLSLEVAVPSAGKDSWINSALKPWGPGYTGY